MSDPLRRVQIMKGSGHELEVAAILAKRGCEVFFPLTILSEADLVVMDIAGQCHRVQVKTAGWCRHGMGGAKPRLLVSGRRFGTRKTRGTRHYTKIDFLVACYEGAYWVIPYSQDLPRHIKLNLSYEPNRDAWGLITGTIPLPVRSVDQQVLSLVAS